MRNEDKRIKIKKISKVGTKNAGQKGSRPITNMWEGDTTMLFASGWGIGMVNVIRIHRASKSRTIRYQKNDEENEKTTRVAFHGSGSSGYSML